MFVSDDIFKPIIINYIQKKVTARQYVYSKRCMGPAV